MATRSKQFLSLTFRNYEMKCPIAVTYTVYKAKKKKMKIRAAKFSAYLEDPPQKSTNLLTRGKRNSKYNLK